MSKEQDSNKTMEKIREKFLKWVEDYADRKLTDPAEIEKAFKFLTLELRNRDFMRKLMHGEKALALRLIKFLPEDAELRKKYIKMTNPDTASLFDNIK